MNASGVLFKRHYPELDFLRALAIIMVLMRHFSDVYLRTPQSPLLNFFGWGWHGVDLFFALSGFLIGGQIIEECSNNSFSFKRFFIKRFWRIFPPYYVAITVYVLFFSYKNGFLIIENTQVLKDVLIHLFYLQDYIQVEGIMYNGVYWSLAVEEKFYLILPLILFIVIKRAKNHILKTIIALSLLAIFMRFFFYDPAIKNIWHTFLVPFHMRFDNLLIGVVASFLFISFKDKFYPWRYVLLSVSVVCLSTTFLYGSLDANYFNICWQFTLSSIGFSALILSIVLINNSPFFKGTFKLVAKYSYSMYLYHLLVLGFLHQYFKPFFSSQGTGTLNTLILFSVYLISIFLFSAIIFFLIDGPCLRLRSKILAR